MPSLVQKMACHLFCAEPLHEPMLYHCQLNPWEQTSVKLYSKFKHFHSRKRILKCRLRNNVHLSLSGCVNRFVIFAGYIIDYQGKDIHVLTHDEKMLNGNLNIIDAVIYRETRHDLGLADHLNSECEAYSGSQDAGTPSNTSDSDGIASDSEVIMFSPGVFVCACMFASMFVRMF